MAPTTDSRITKPLRRAAIRCSAWFCASGSERRTQHGDDAAHQRDKAKQTEDLDQFQRQRRSQGVRSCGQHRVSFGFAIGERDLDFHESHANPGSQRNRA
jgi:hypothetical protein